MRRALTFVLVALATAAASSAWLYDGDLGAAVSPVIPVQSASAELHPGGPAEPAVWNADALAAKQGIVVPAEAPVPETPMVPPPGALPGPPAPRPTPRPTPRPGGH